MVNNPHEKFSNELITVQFCQQPVKYWNYDKSKIDDEKVTKIENEALYFKCGKPSCDSPERDIDATLIEISHSNN